MVKSKIMIEDCNAYILAGGRSERMGRDKASLEWGKTTFVEYLYSSLKKIFKDVFVIVKKKVNKDNRYLEDLLEDYSPLTGIYTALKHSERQYVFVKACDNPLISEELIYEMYNYTNNNYDVIVPKAKDGLHPLYAFYSRGILLEIERLLENKIFKIINLYENCRVKYIRENEIKKFDKDLITIRNINTPEDLKNFRKLFGEGNI